MKKLLTAAVAASIFSLPASAAAPDLVGDFNVATGVVTVKNDSATPAGASVVTIKCQRRKPPVVGGGGGCPEIPRTFLPNYTNPAFPNALAVNVPPLAPGGVFNHALPFFGGLVFPPGAYAFTTRVDAGGVVAESNEANNVIVRTKVVP
jgi:hypothetical protein